MSVTLNARHGVCMVADALAKLYRRAPASVMTIGSMALSYVVTKAIEDYRLFVSLGEGGLGAPSMLTWLANVLVLRPFALSVRAASDPNCLPLDDQEWTKLLQASSSSDSDGDPLHGLPLRKGLRPRTAGLVPHRQIENVAQVGGELQRALIAHLETLAERHPRALTLDVSAYEGGSAPCLFVEHRGRGGTATDPTIMARFYLSGTPGPAARRDSGVESDRSYKHEVAHVHRTEGSMHLVLSPQDCRRVVSHGWGELHRLAGMAYRGHYLPPYWLPRWLYRGSEAKLRWGYQQRMLAAATAATTPRSGSLLLKGKLLPPTYVCVYAPTNDEELLWIQRIIDSSISWSLGYRV